MYRSVGVRRKVRFGVVCSGSTSEAGERRRSLDLGDLRTRERRRVVGRGGGGRRVVEGVVRRDWRAEWRGEEDEVSV